MQIKLILALLIALLLVIFAVQNPTPINLRFFGWETGDVSLIIIIFGAALLGVIVASLLGLIKQLELRNIIRQLENDIETTRRLQNRDNKNK